MILSQIEKISRVSKAEKYKAESDAMIKIKNKYLNGSEIGKRIHDLWIEYEQQQSFEAHLVKVLDKLDMIIQAEEYEKMELQCVQCHIREKRQCVFRPRNKDIDT